MLPTIAALSVMPTLARIFAADRAYFRSMLVNALRLALGLGLVVAFGVAALADPIIGLLYKPGMAAAAPVLRWLIFGAVLTTLDQMLSSTMLAAKAQRHDLGALALSVTVLALGLVVLVPRLAATGAAMAVTLAICCRVAYRVHWVVRLLELEHVVRDFGRVLLAAAAGIAALVTALPHGAPAALGASLAAYLAVLLATGALGPHALAEAGQRLKTLVGR
jgi:O-antigen/teichoic acid export membrane protein